MAKIKQRFSNLSILPTFILITMSFIVLAILLTECEKTVIRNAQYAIAFQYSDIVEGFNAEKVWGNNYTAIFSEYHSNLMRLYESLNWILPPLTYIICLFLAGLLFFKKKIQYPLSLLTTAADKISKADLDFSIQYDRKDEMGMLCAAFEKMRSTLEDNYREMWRQMDERKQLNAAFSHDLRTPLTVLEGHLDILKKYVPDGKLTMEDIIDTYKVMSMQIERLKDYVSSMNTLQRLEDISITVKAIDTIEFMENLKDTADIILDTKQLLFHNKVDLPILFIDKEIIMQVYENVLSNAARYAQNTVSITCTVINDTFSICIIDDGNGFDKVSLKSATAPFYSTEKKKSNQHFGLGLNISKILCQRHNGNIILDNCENGGAMVTISFGLKS